MFGHAALHMATDSPPFRGGVRLGGAHSLPFASISINGVVYKHGLDDFLSGARWRKKRWVVQVSSGLNQ